MANDGAAALVSCAKCGLQNPVGNRFCGNCGSPLSVEPAADPTLSLDELKVATAAADPAPAVEKTLPLEAATVSTVAANPILTSVTQNIAPAKAATPSVAPSTTPHLTGVALERERDRLLTLANVQRMRDQTAKARKTLEQALALMDGMPGHQVAPIHELIGDLYDGEARWDDARKAYSTSHELDPKRASAERKFAALTLRVAETMPGNSLAEAMLRGDSIADLLATGALASDRGKRNAGIAMLLSAAIPGFGQFYNGEIVKGAIILATYAATLLYFAVSPDREVFVHKFAAILALSRSHAANASVSPISVIIGVLMVAVWLYAIVDAPFMAAKTPGSSGAGGPVIDKSGWEV